MKKSVFRLICLMIAALPAAATAQTNIKSAFDAIIKCKDAQIVESHTLEKDPGTNVKIGQSDVYRFTLPANKDGLVKAVTAAFEKDSEAAYSINRGKSVNTERDIVLMVGNDEENGVHINNPDCEYIYALFLPPKSEDRTGNYRYAYAMNCKEKDGKLVGKLVVTYATTLKYRQEQEQQRKLRILKSFDQESSVFDGFDTQPLEQQTWFEMLMSYIQPMTQANTQTRIALASKAYRHISELPDYPEVTEQDKNAAREILKGMISEPKYSETVLNRLLNQCLVAIK